MPEVSVIIPTYNRARLLQQALESVAAQSFRDWECLVIDDGSTDDTRAVVERFAAADPRVRYAWQENASAAAARCRGLALAAGAFIAFLDSDDLWPPDKLQWQVEALRADPEAAVVYGEAFVFRDGDLTKGNLYQADWPEKPSGWVFDQVLTRSFLLSPGMALIRAEVLRRWGRFDPSLPSAEDWDMWLGLAKLGPFRFEPRVALYYRYHHGCKSANAFRNYSSADRVMRRHLEGLPPGRRSELHARVRRYFRAGYTDRLMQQASELEAAGDWETARLVWRAVASLDPGQLRRRQVLQNVIWALLPTRTPPFWRAPWIRPYRRLLRPLRRGPRLLAGLCGGGAGRHASLAKINGARHRLAWTLGRVRIKLRRPGRPLIVVGLVEHVGDIIAAEPIARFLRRAHPDAYLVWAVKERFRELVDGNPHLDEVLPLGCLTEWSALADGGPWDACFDLHQHGRWCETCRIPHVRPDPRGVRLGRHYEHGNLLQVFCKLGGLPPLDEGPRLYTRPEDRRAVDALELPDDYVVIHGTSNEVLRNWDPGKWDELVRRLRAAGGPPVVEVGLRPVIAGAGPGYTDLCGRLSLLQTAEVIRRARAFVGVDSGPAHMANAAGTFGIILLGAYLGFEYYMPFSGAYADGTNAAIIRADGPLASLPVDRVLEPLLARVLTRPEARPAPHVLR